MKATTKWQSHPLHHNIRNLSLTKLLIICLFIGLFVLCVVWFWQNFERVDKIDYELNNRVTYNPFYAAELLINQQHTSAEKADDDPTSKIAHTDLDSDLKSLIDNLPAIDPKAAQQPTVLINSIGGTLTPERFEKLRSWMAEGGHVITFTQADVSEEDLAALLARLQVLKKQAIQENKNQSVHGSDGVQKKFIDLVNHDAQANELMSVMGEGNQLLLRLGIFAVNPAQEDTDTKDEQEDEAAKKNITNETNETTTVSAKVEQKSAIDSKDTLRDELAFIFQTVTPLSVDEGKSLILVQTDNYYDYLDTQMFEQLYGSEQSLLPKTSQPAQAQQIRHYLQQQLTTLQAIRSQQNINSEDNSDENTTTTETVIRKAIKKNAADDNKNDQTDEDAQSVEESIESAFIDKIDNVTIKNKQENTLYLIKLLTAALALDDQTLISLFAPVDDVFFDSTYGKGRISVLIDNQSFSNPDPNRDLTKNDTSSSAGTLANAPYSNPVNAPLFHLLDWQDTHINLSSMDNADWLLSLTKNSSQVLILPNTDIDSLPVMLWKNARLATLGLLLLVLVWLWSLYNRFGKLQQLSAHQAHDILRYFQQVGQYGWQQDRAFKLSWGTRQQVQQLLQRHLAQLSNVPASTQSMTQSTSTASDGVSVHNLTDKTTNIATDIDEMLINLQHLLTQRLQDKLQLNKQRQQGDTDKSVNDWLDKALRHNQHKAQQAISLTRLQLAVAPLLSPLLSDHTPSLDNADQMDRANVQSNKLINAYTAVQFTEMTQTLWVIQWLLK